MITPAPQVVALRGWNQAGGGPGRNSYRPDLTVDPLKLAEHFRWKPRAGWTVSRVQVVAHPAGNRLWVVQGPAGGYDDPWKTSPHQYPYVTALLDLEGNQIASSGPAVTWSATFEGPWAAFWLSPSLPNWMLGRFLDGGQATSSISGAAGTTLSTGLIGSYAEQVGATAVSERLGILAQLQRRAWHGGTRPTVAYETLDGKRKVGLWGGEAWTETSTDEDGLIDGGVAIAEGSRSVVATLNRRRMKNTPQNGLYAWPIDGGVPIGVKGGTWSAPAVAPDGFTAYAVREGVHLVELNTATGAVREVATATGTTNSEWPSPPIVTANHVMLIEPSLTGPDVDARPLGDLVAYDRATLKIAWRYPARIISNVDLLSGWSRADVFYAAVDSASIFVAGNDGLYAIREKDGSLIRWIFSDPAAPEGFANPQLLEGGLVLQNNFRWRVWPQCQDHLCPDGKPVGEVDYGRCCRGVTHRCEFADCKKCEQAYGWCANENERFRMMSPSSVVYGLEARP